MNARSGFSLALLGLLVLAVSGARAKEKEKGHPVEIKADKRTDEEKKKHEKAVKRLVMELRREKNKTMLLSRISQFGETGGAVERGALILLCRGNKNQTQLSGAFKALAEIGGVESLNFLCGKTALKAPSDWVVQRAAADALAELGDARSACCLIDVIENRRQKAGVRAASLVTLARVAPGNEEAVKTIFDLANSKDDALRGASMTALGHLASDASFKVLAERARKERNGQVRGLACTALGIHGSRAGIEVLREVIRTDKALQVKEAAMIALKELGAGM